MAKKRGRGAKASGAPGTSNESEKSTTENRVSEVDEHLTNADSGAESLVQSNLETTTRGPTLDVDEVVSADTADSDWFNEDFRGFEHVAQDIAKDFEVCLDGLLAVPTRCEICVVDFSNQQALDEHQAAAGHYKCVIPHCALVLGSAKDLADHLISCHKDGTVHSLPSVGVEVPLSPNVGSQSQLESSPETPPLRSTSPKMPTLELPSLERPSSKNPSLEPPSLEPHFPETPFLALPSLELPSPKTPSFTSSSPKMVSQKPPSPITRRTLFQSPSSDLAAISQGQSSTIQFLISQKQQQITDQPNPATVVVSSDVASSPAQAFTLRKRETIPKLKKVSSPIKQLFGTATQKQVAHVGLPANHRLTGSPVKDPREMSGKSCVTDMDDSGQNYKQIVLPPTTTITAISPKQTIQRPSFSMKSSEVRLSSPHATVPSGGIAPAVRATKRPAAVMLAEKRPNQLAIKRLFGNSLPILPRGGHSNNAAQTAISIPNLPSITVTPSNATPPQPVTTSQPVHGRSRQCRQVQANSVTTLNLNSSVSITTANSNISHPKTTTTSPWRDISRKPRQRSPLVDFQATPTVDLTIDLTEETPVNPSNVSLTTSSANTSSSQPRDRGRPRKHDPATCPVCDKVFAFKELLAPHMMTHVDQSSGAFNFKCNVCGAQYSTKAALTKHTLTYHPKPTVGGNFNGETGGTKRPATPSPDWVIPIVDLSQLKNFSALNALGVRFCVSLSSVGQLNRAPVRSINAALTTAERANVGNLIDRN